MTPADVLREALARLDGGRLWVKGPVPEGWQCAWTALKVLEDSDEGERALGRAMRFLTAATPPGYDRREGVMAYNDDPATTWDDVEALYHRAIKLAEEAQR